MYQTQGSAAPKGSVVSLSGETLGVPFHQKQILVFWATWCGPCSVELARIDKLIELGKISAADVLAVSVMEEPALVEKFAKEKNYRFQVAVDRSGELAHAYGVSGTPTIALIDQAGLIHWLTVGLSPTLEMRVLSFFAP